MTAAYIGFDVDAGHLLTASVMSAPASVVIAKIMIPEIEVQKTMIGAAVQTDDRRHRRHGPFSPH